LIPAHDMRILRNYKYSCGTFSEILDDRNTGNSNFHVYNILVMYKDNYPIGWCIHYKYP
jgi:hypothetical protein